MHNSKNKIKNIDYSRLPPAPHALIKLIDLFHQADVSFEALEAIISKDTALSAKILSISNSAAYSQWNETRELKQVLVVLGTQTVKSIAITSAVHQFFSRFNNELGETLGSLWLDSLICAHISRQLAEITGYPNPDEAHLAGLMHKLGQLVLLSNDPEGYQSIMASATDQNDLLFQEQQQYAIQNAELASHIIEQWELDSFLHDAVAYQFKAAELLQDAQPLVKLINLSSHLCNRLNHQHNNYLVEDHFFALNQSVIENLIQQASEAAIADASHFGVKVDKAQDIPRANIDDEPVRLELARRVRQIALLEGVENNITQIDDISEMMQQISENLQLLFGLSSTLFFFPDLHQSQLTGIAGQGKHIPVNDCFTIKLTANRSLVSESALRQSLLVSLQQTIFPELPVIDRQITSALRSEQFIAIPLVSNDQVMGVIAAGCDNQQAELLLRENDLLCHFSTIIAATLYRLQHKQQECQQQLEFNQQENNIHARKIIHEVNNPLTIINNYLEILAMEMEPDSDSKAHLETIQSEMNRVSKILLQLKQEQTSTPDDSSQVDINLIISNLIGIFKPTFYKLNQISSELELDPDLPVISAEINKLKQILTNLLKNSAEALPEKGIITIRTNARVIQNNNQFIEITISDNGPGIPEKILDHLFSPVKSTKGANHSGLGLTIVNKLVQELNGSISYSTSDQGGAKFIILFPRN